MKIQNKVLQIKAISIKTNNLGLGEIVWVKPTSFSKETTSCLT